MEDRHVFGRGPQLVAGLVEQSFGEGGPFANGSGNALRGGGEGFVERLSAFVVMPRHLVDGGLHGFAGLFEHGSGVRGAFLDERRDAVSGRGEALVERLTMNRDGRVNSLAGFRDAGDERVAMGGDGRADFLAFLAEARRQRSGLGAEAFDQRRVAGAEAGVQILRLAQEGIGDALRGLRQFSRDLVARRGEASREFGALVLEFGAARVESIGDDAGRVLDLAGDVRAGRRDARREIGAARIDFRGARGETVGDEARGLREFGGDLVADRGETGRHVGAAGVDLSDQRIPRAGQGQADFLALHAERRRDASSGFADAQRHAVARLLEFLRKGFLRIGDGGAHPVGVGQNRLALGGEFVDELAHAPLVVGVGPLEIGDFRPDHGFKFAGARQRALQPVAHGGDFAADGLRQSDDLVGGERLRIGEPEGHFRHGAGRVPHFARAARERRGDEKENHGTNGDQPPERELFHRERTRLFQIPGEKSGQAEPSGRSGDGERERRATGTILQGLEDLADRSNVVVGRPGTWRHGSARGSVDPRHAETLVGLRRDGGGRFQHVEARFRQFDGLVRSSDRRRGQIQRRLDRRQRGFRRILGLWTGRHNQRLVHASRRWSGGSGAPQLASERLDLLLTNCECTPRDRGMKPSASANHKRR